MMRPIRRNRLITVAFLFAGATLTVALVLLAVDENLNLFYPPELVTQIGNVTGIYCLFAANLIANLRNEILRRERSTQWVRELVAEAPG